MSTRSNRASGGRRRRVASETATRDQPRETPLAVRLSGGPGRERFRWQGQPLSQLQVQQALEAAGVEVLRSCKDYCYFVVYPDGAPGPSASARAAVGDEADAVPLRRFVEEQLSDAQRELFERSVSRFAKKVAPAARASPASRQPQEPRPRASGRRGRRAEQPSPPQQQQQEVEEERGFVAPALLESAWDSSPLEPSRRPRARREPEERDDEEDADDQTYLPPDLEEQFAPAGEDDEEEEEDMRRDVEDELVENPGFLRRVWNLLQLTDGGGEGRRASARKRGGSGRKNSSGRAGGGRRSSSGARSNSNSNNVRRR